MSMTLEEVGENLKRHLLKGEIEQERKRLERKGISGESDRLKRLLQAAEETFR